MKIDVIYEGYFLAYIGSRIYKTKVQKGHTIFWRYVG